MSPFFQISMFFKNLPIYSLSKIVNAPSSQVSLVRIGQSGQVSKVRLPQLDQLSQVSLVRLAQLGQLRELVQISQLEQLGLVSQIMLIRLGGKVGLVSVCDKFQRSVSLGSCPHSAMSLTLELMSFAKKVTMVFLPVKTLSF